MVTQNRNSAEKEEEMNELDKNGRNYSGLQILKKFSLWTKYRAVNIPSLGTRWSCIVSQLHTLAVCSPDIHCLLG
jgi:hypothetical protein